MSSSSSSGGGCIGITAHRTGEYFGAAVPESIQQGGDATQYVVLTNNDRDRQLASFAKDFSASRAATPGSGLTPTDDDLAALTLRNCHPTPTEGRIRIELSNPSAVRLFKSDGYPLGSLNVDLVEPPAVPTGDLAALALGEITIWLEGVLPDRDFVFNLVFETTSGAELRRDTVHILLAELTLRSNANAEIDFVAAFPLESILVAGNAPSLPLPQAQDSPKPFFTFPTQLPTGDDIYYRIRIDPLPTSAISQLKVASDDVSADYYFDQFTPSALLSVSTRLGVLYWAQASDVILSGDRTAVRNNLSLNVVHGKSATLRLDTTHDSHRRRLPGVQIVPIVPSAHPVGGRLAAEFSPTVAVELDCVGTGLPAPSSVQWTAPVTTPDVVSALTPIGAQRVQVTADNLACLRLEARFTLAGQVKTATLILFLTSSDLCGDPVT